MFNAFLGQIKNEKNIEIYTFKEDLHIQLITDNLFSLAYVYLSLLKTQIPIKKAKQRKYFTSPRL